MDFYEELQQRGIEDILRPVPYVVPVFHNSADVLSTLTDCILKNKKTLIYGDYDVDGAMCALGIRDAFRDLGHTNHEVYPYRQRTHALDPVYVRRVLQEGIECAIICDTGSSDLTLLKRMVDAGVEVIVLDHHQSTYSYDNFKSMGVHIVNTTIENNYLDLQCEEYTLSAGALVFCIAAALYAELGKEFPRTLSAYALVSLYADCMSMKARLNRSIYYVAISLLTRELPKIIQIGLNRYQVFGRRFIEYTFSPKLNAAFRAEEFTYLNTFLFSDDVTPVLLKAWERMDTLQDIAREMSGKVADMVRITTLHHFIYANLQDVANNINIVETKLWNYTGLIANMLSTQFGKAAVVVCDAQTQWKGSVRDLYGRNFLTIFRNICEAGGHNSAFGFQLQGTTAELQEFKQSLAKLDMYCTQHEVQNKPIVINCETLKPDVKLLTDMARYNEFAGSDLPVAYFRKSYVGGIQEIYTSFGYKYVWDDVTFSSKCRLTFGERLIARPTIGMGLRLYVEKEVNILDSVCL